MTIFDNTFKKIRPHKKDHILYKIVDVYIEKGTEYYKLQCSYTKVILHVTIQDIVFDLDILHGLHPIQGCFIGIEYAKILKTTTKNPKLQDKQQNKYSICRYGNHNLLYQDRKGLVGFECRDNDEQFLMDPRDIALSRDLNVSGFVAYIIANLVNSYILSRWKVLLKGRYFWLRSLGASTFSEAIYSLIAILMMEIGSIPNNTILRVVTISFSIKVLYSIVLAGPANLLVNHLKNITGIDVYDFPKKFTPFKYSKDNQASVI